MIDLLAGTKPPERTGGWVYKNTHWLVYVGAVLMGGTTNLATAHRLASVLGGEVVAKSELAEYLRGVANGDEQ